MINGIIAGQDQYTPLQFSRSRKFSDITISSDGLTATIPSSGGYKTVLGNIGKSSGKWQYELITVQTGGEYSPGVVSDTVNVLAFDWRIGVAGSASAQSIGLYREQASMHWNFTSGSSSVAGVGVGAPFFENNTVLTVTVDLSTPASPIFSFYRNGVFYKQRTGSLATAWYPGLTAGYATVLDSAIATLRGAGLQYPVSGFTEWNAG